MNPVLASLLVVISTGFHPSLITEAEARRLAIDAAYASGVPRRFVLDAEVSDRTDRRIAFRVFAQNQDPATSSDLAGWFAVDLETAELSDPILDDKPIALQQVKHEQQALRVLHCRNT